jgi:hypothetical protein
MNANHAAAMPFVREPGAGSTLDVLGVTHIYKATAAETGGLFSLWESVVPPGGGTPQHTCTRWRSPRQGYGVDWSGTAPPDREHRAVPVALSTKHGTCAAVGRLRPRSNEESAPVSALYRE